MTISSRTLSGSSQGTRSSGSKNDPELQVRLEKKRKQRKESNRESARRTRMRKQQHLSDLTSQVNQLKNQNQQLSMALSVTTQNLVAVQAQNSVLQTQKMELESRLCALCEILLCVNSITNTMGIASSSACDIFGASTWSQPIDMYQGL